MFGGGLGAGRGGRRGQGRGGANRGRGGQGQGRGGQGQGRGGQGQGRGGQGQGRGGQGQGRGGQGQGRGGQGQGRGGQGQGRGGQGQGQGRRRYDDDKEFNAMRDSPEVREFFKFSAIYKQHLSGEGLLSLVTRAKITQSDNRDLRHQFLIRLTQSKFLEMGGPVAGTIMQLVQGQRVNIMDFNDAMNILLDIMDEMINRIPHVMNTIPYITTILTLLGKVKHVLYPEVQIKLDTVLQGLSDPGLLVARIQDPTQSWSADVSFIREPIIPEMEVLLHSSLEKCFSNPTKGGFQSSAHYLETWFRLMREDFIGPLRDAIKDFQKTFKSTDMLRRKRIRVDGGYHYTIEKVVQRDVIDGEYYVLAQIAQEELQHVNWGHTDRLRFDSMMVLSNDHFETGRFAMITNNDARPAKRGQEVWLKMMMNAPMEMETFQGIEPMAFYEPSRCVMERLKVVAARVDEGVDLPMNKYLVNVNKSVTPPPYLRYGTQINLPGGSYTVSGALNISELGLDHSQEKAMKLALTHELALIQGPPGTGKSYVGAMFVHIMMLNKNLWQTHDRGCMLLLAYKNHAIDQFIGECERMGMDMSRTVRLGSRSSLSMEKYQLRNKRKELQDLHEYKFVNWAVREKRKQLVQVEETIKHMRRCIRCKNADMDMTVYQHLMPGYVKYQLWCANPEAQNRDMVLLWLSNGQPNYSNAYQALATCPLVADDVVDTIYEEYANSIWTMPLEFRYQLYIYWCKTAREEVERYINEWQKLHDKLTYDMKDIRHAQDVAVVRRADILAMTTTGASKHGHLIDAVKPTIVLCEEAAEVLESHIVAPLTDGCKHVVLIGDHKQLRPSVNNFSMEKRNLSISLFERMIENELPSQRLQIQHRMHPDIADLLVPHIYDSLENHASVHEYPDVKGVQKRMHFFHHDHAEQKVGEKSSCRNPFEADYLVYLTHYLLQQGKYKPSDITILTTYMGQMRLIKEKINTFKQAHPEPMYTKEEKLDLIAEEFADYISMQEEINDGLINRSEMDNKMRHWYNRRKEEFEYKTKQIDTPRSKIQDVRATTVDNYQGEECTIILLSFVRSNKQCNIGFLKWANRICVALSRAKHGFYAIGDFKLFARNEKSDLWKKLCTQLLTSPESRLSDKFQIVCHMHGTKRHVTEPKQFLELAPEGGCQQPCEHRLVKCGHTCTRKCHPADRAHNTFVCVKPCQGTLECGHTCGRRCDKDGDEKSFFATQQARLAGSSHFRKCLIPTCTKSIHCTETIEIIPERCHHPGTTTCSAKESYICQKIVQFDLDCGHKQKEPCYTKKTEIKCRTKVVVDMDCGHTITRPCHEKKPRCRLKIMKRLDCGHEKEIMCAERNNLDIPCVEQVDVKLKCGHHRIVPCPQRVTTLSETCTDTIPVTLSCGHVDKMPCTNSNEGGRLFELYKARHIISAVCEVKVDITLKCKHKLTVKCAESRALHQCKVEVERTLSCGHKVKEACHVQTTNCSVDRVERLRCGHELKAKCPEFDLLKQAGCSVRVMVNKVCGHKEFVSCRDQSRDSVHSVCEEQCTMKCSHGTKCTALCSRPCPRCMKPCQNECPHSKCTKRCYEECDRKPCDKPCEKKLPCGHPCTGVCGELCLKLCVKCQPKRARKGKRIRIEPCDHDFTIEQMDKHMTVHENAQVQQVEVKVCPMKHCGSVITKCPRYANQIKRYLQLPKLAEYARLASSMWWYCKTGHHYVGYPKHVGMAVASSHTCAVSRHLRVETAGILTEPTDEAQAELPRPEELRNNELFQNILAGRGVGRGGRRGGFGPAERPTAGRLGQLQFRQAERPVRGQQNGRRPGREHRPPVDLMQQLTLEDVDRAAQNRQRRREDSAATSSVAGDLESLADDLDSVLGDTDSVAGDHEGLLTMDSDGEEWGYNDLY